MKSGQVRVFLLKGSAGFGDGAERFDYEVEAAVS